MSLPEDVENGLSKLLEMKKKAVEVHPLFRRIYPLAVFSGGELLVFEPEGSSYRYSGSFPAELPEEIFAAFPLKETGWKTAAVVSRRALSSEEGLVFILHEFVHCYQAECCETELKRGLRIAREYWERGDYSWELEHPFPYEDGRFVELYSALLGGELERIPEIRAGFREVLSEKDFEYMVWEEWKEGFARLIENRLRALFGLPENHAGGERPFSRVTFYEGGARLIEWLCKTEPHLYHDLRALFERMMAL
ncbi:hypothetical protein [Thermococcus henrietii]|uniref:hypothetical protein n=1 Tax=Thermococcus henrietii TaxID=2016361 RepID=UPI000C06FFE8|nr:hypothetical protein [Thermococcus henrietii]